MAYADALSHHKAGRHAVAVVELEAILSADPASEPAWRLLAACHFAQRRYVDAEAALRRSAELAPQDAAVWANLGALLHTLERESEARDCLEHALALNPEHARARQELARLRGLASPGASATESSLATVGGPEVPTAGATAATGAAAPEGGASRADRPVAAFRSGQVRQWAEWGPACFLFVGAMCVLTAGCMGADLFWASRTALLPALGMALVGLLSRHLRNTLGGWVRIGLVACGISLVLAAAVIYPSAIGPQFLMPAGQVLAVAGAVAYLGPRTARSVVPIGFVPLAVEALTVHDHTRPITLTVVAGVALAIGSAWVHFGPARFPRWVLGVLVLVAFLGLALVGPGTLWLGHVALSLALSGAAALLFSQQWSVPAKVVWAACGLAAVVTTPSICSWLAGVRVWVPWAGLLLLLAGGTQLLLTERWSRLNRGKAVLAAVVAILFCQAGYMRGYSSSRLLGAARDGDAAAVRKWLALGASTRVRFGKRECRRTPLQIAAHMGKVDAVKALLQHGADREARDHAGETALHLTAWRAGQGWSEVTAIDQFGHIAAMRGGVTYLVSEDQLLEVAEVLIRAGCNVNTANAHGVTPLHAAAGDGMPSMVRLLLESGADVDATDKDLRTPLHAAAVNHPLGVRALKLLLEYGADPNAADLRAQTPLDQAVQLRADEAVELLRRHGASG